MAEKTMLEIVQAHAEALRAVKYLEERKRDIKIEVFGLFNIAELEEVVNIIRRHLEVHLVEAVELGEKYLQSRVDETGREMTEAQRGKAEAAAEGPLRTFVVGDKDHEPDEPELVNHGRRHARHPRGKR